MHVTSVKRHFTQKKGEHGLSLDIVKQWLSYGDGNRYGNLKTKTDETIKKRMRFFSAFDDPNLASTNKTLASQSSSNVYTDVVQSQALSDISCGHQGHPADGGSVQSHVGVSQLEIGNAPLGPIARTDHVAPSVDPTNKLIKAIMLLANRSDSAPPVSTATGR